MLTTKWTDEEIAILKNNLSKPASEIKNLFVGRSEQAVRSKMFYLKHINIAQPKEKPAENSNPVFLGKLEEAILKTNAGIERLSDVVNKLAEAMQKQSNTLSEAIEAI